MPNLSDENNSKNNHTEEHQNNCYITTILCEILGCDDNTYYLTALRKFRNEILEKNNKYTPYLIEYDIIGPIIARKLLQDKNRRHIAEVITQQFISKAVYQISQENEQGAINYYSTMMNLLAEYYDIDISAIIARNNSNSTSYTR